MSAKPWELDDDGEVDELAAAMGSPQALFRMEVIEAYDKLRSLSDAILEAHRGNEREMPKVTDLARTFFKELDDIPEPVRLQNLNPFPEFDAVQFFDVDPNDPEHTHYYLVPNEKTGELEEARGSGTGFIHSFFDPFEDKEHAKRIALEILHCERRNFDDYRRMQQKLEEKRGEAYEFVEKDTLRDSMLLATIRNYEAAKTAKTWDSVCDEAQYKAQDFRAWKELRDGCLALWEWGSASGTALHRSIEVFLDKPLETPWHNMVYHTLEFRYFLNLLRDMCINGPVRILRSELRVCDWRDNRTGTYHEQRSELDSCPDFLKEMLCATYLTGSADLIFREEGMAENEIGIGDWKRSKRIYQSAFEGKKGRGPCSELPDCNLYHYYLQLNLYAYLIELNTKYRVVKLWIAVFHPSNPNYVLYHVPEMRTTVHLMLIERIKYNLSDVFTSDSPEDQRKRAQMQKFLKNKKINTSNIKELLGGESYQINQAEKSKPKKRKIDQVAQKPAKEAPLMKAKTIYDFFKKPKPVPEGTQIVVE